MEKTLDKFLRYIKIDTQSSEDSKTTPSTKKQWDLLNLLKKELDSMKIKNSLSEFGYIYAFVPSNDKTKKDSIGFVAHVDTSPDASGANVQARIIKKYKGDKIKLSTKWSMDPKTFEDLKKVKGDDIIVTNGETLLGADDKAGVAEIMSLLEDINNIKHGDVYVCFTPDEEIGMGTSHIDLKQFKPKNAFTVDGDDVNCIEYETFNAASATVNIYGKSVHPGSAKNKMVNSMLVGLEFQSMLPQNMLPQNTEKYEGFNHMTGFNGNVEQTKLSYIIRNHDKNKFNNQKKFFKDLEAKLNKKYGYKVIEVILKDQYYNMGDVIKKDLSIINKLKKSMLKVGLKPYVKPIRGGTDGSALTYMGIPTPNIGGGGFNFHGRYEFLSINQMNKAVELLKEIVRTY